MSRPKKFCAVFLIVSALGFALNAADITWNDDAGADSNWSSADNWDLDRIPVATDVVHFDDATVGTNVVDSDFTIAGLTYDNTAGTHDTVIDGGQFLTVSNYLRVGSSIPATSKVRISGPGGTLKIIGDIQVSGTNTGSLVIQ